MGKDVARPHSRPLCEAGCGEVPSSLQRRHRRPLDKPEELWPPAAPCLSLPSVVVFLPLLSLPSVVVFSFPFLFSSLLLVVVFLPFLSLYPVKVLVQLLADVFKD